MLTIKHNRQGSFTPEFNPKKFAWPAIKHPPRPAPVFIGDRLIEMKNRVLKKHGITQEELFSTKRVKALVEARREFILIIYRELKWHPTKIAKFLGMDRTTVQYHIGLRKKSKVKYGAFKND